MSRRRLLSSALVAGSAGVAGVVLGRATAEATPNVEPGEQLSATPADAPSFADIGFCTDMTAHHVQALVMCQRVLGRDTGDAVQAAAAEVLQNQAIEVGQMRAWLTDWGHSTSPPETVMSWMPMSSPETSGTDHDEMTDATPMTLEMMPGYASTAELLELSTATGIAQGRRWLELMRAHHVGGIAMAAAAIELATIEKVIRLAESQAAAQSFEVSQYDQLLAGPYAG
jgi:uncharacterized protein (DUF305 family)